MQARHVGDLGNIAADDNGVADIKIEDRMAKMRSGGGGSKGVLYCKIGLAHDKLHLGQLLNLSLSGENSIIGKAIVIHAGRKTKN